MKNICLLIVLLFVPQIACGATVTENILDALGFYETSWDKFLEQSDTNTSTSTWQCGSLNGEIVRYQVNGDILGYNIDKDIWIRLITPMSSTLPVTALGLFMNGDGNVSRRVTVMEHCSTVQEQFVKSQNAPVQKPSPKSEILGEKVLSQRQDAVEEKTAVIKLVQEKVQRSAEMNSQADNVNIDATSVASTWELMSAYQKHMGE